LQALQDRLEQNDAAALVPAPALQQYNYTYRNGQLSGTQHPKEPGKILLKIFLYCIQ
jgi:hypothetical protein